MVKIPSLFTPFEKIDTKIHVQNAVFVILIDNMSSEQMNTTTATTTVTTTEHDNKIHVILCGNDGTGKTTLVSRLNECGRNLYVFHDRNTSHEGVAALAKAFDDFTLSPTVQNSTGDRPDLPSDPNLDVAFLVLDCDPSISSKRIKDRGEPRDRWESHKALHYYRQRYRELAAYYGLPLVNSSGSVSESVKEALYALDNREETELYGIRYLTPQDILDNDIEQQLFSESTKPEKVKDYFGIFENTIPQFLMVALQDIEEYPKDHGSVDDLLPKLCARHMARHGEMEMDEELIQFKYVDDKNDKVHKQYVQRSPTKPLFRLVCEGESKKVYLPVTGNRNLQGTCFIILKSTIYSHSMQATGTIKDLAKVRALGSQFFVEMMNRNGLYHTYNSVNSEGVVSSEYLTFIPMTEIVVKKGCHGTDKHSFYGLKGEDMMVSQENADYRCGPYVRFDWRNPNHVYKPTMEDIHENPYYYVFEQFLGKEKFFRGWIKSDSDVVPVGDKNISQEIVSTTIDTEQTRESALQMFLTISYYFRKVGLKILDICYMLDRDGKRFWSEINQDCMRIKIAENNESLDKDLWRAGGSSSKEQLVLKWKQFNEIMLTYFTSHSFHTTEMLQPYTYPYIIETEKVLENDSLQLLPGYERIYRRWIRRNTHRKVILTLDISNNQPRLTMESQYKDLNTEQALQFLSMGGDVMVNDMDRDISPHETNERLIKTHAMKYHYYVSGGIEDTASAKRLLDKSVRRVVIEEDGVYFEKIAIEDSECGPDECSDYDPQEVNDFINLVKSIPPNRLIVDVAMDASIINPNSTESMKMFRRVITKIKKYGVEAIRISIDDEFDTDINFRKTLLELSSYLSDMFKKVIIRSGFVQTIEDLRFIWSIRNFIPQLGNVIWNRTIPLEDLVVEMTNFGVDGTVPICVQDTSHQVKGLIHADQKTLKKIVSEQKVYEYHTDTRKTTLVTCGENTHQVVSLSLSRDNQSILLTVDTSTAFTSDPAQYSRFSMRQQDRNNISLVVDHINRKMNLNESKYLAKMKKTPGVAALKVWEEYWELLSATAYKDKIHESADIVFHMLALLNGLDISWKDVVRELNSRKHMVKLNLPTVKKVRRYGGRIVIGVNTKKYTDKTDEYMKEHLGVKLIRGEGKNLYLDYQVCDQAKFDTYFKKQPNNTDNDEPNELNEVEIKFIGLRPKDMPYYLGIGLINGCVTYNTVMDNYPKVSTQLHKTVAHELRLCLIKRKDDVIKTREWGKNGYKPKIVAEHSMMVDKYLNDNLHLTDDRYSIVKCLGSSESVLVNDDTFLLVDAIVETGSTLKENNLTVWKTVLKSGKVTIGLYEGPKGLLN